MAANSTDNKNLTLIPSTAAKTTFLVIFLLFGLFGNLFLIITIGSNRKHRSTVVNIITVNLAVTNILDCLLNFSFAIGYTVSPSVDLDSDLCRTNSFFMNLVTIETPLILTLFSIDRFIYSVFPDRYVSIQNIPRTLFMILYTWIHALTFSFPLVAGLITIEIYENLSVCLPAEDINTGYLTFYTLFCYILPLCAMVVFFIFIIKSTLSQREHIQTIKTQNQYTKDSDSDRLLCLIEVSSTRFVGILCLAWLFCQMPFISTYIVRLTFKNINLSPYVNVTLLWLKFSYVMALPLLAFIMNKDILQTFKDMIFCKKRNSVDNATNKEYSPDSSRDSLSERLKVKVNDEKKSAKEEGVNKETLVRNTGFQVPVLFATSHGVHIHTLNDDESLSENDDVYDNPNVMKCDVAGSQDFLNQCDTSDYDSSNELDPFSVSHPVTSKSVRDSDETLQRRSNSHPEVRMKSADKSRTSITVSTVVDSGLDISTTKTTLLNSTTDTSKMLLVTHKEHNDHTQICDKNKFSKEANIPGEINVQNHDPNLQASTCIVDDTDKVPYSNCYMSDFDSTITSVSDTMKNKKKKKRKEKNLKTKTTELSHTSNGLLDMRPPTRLQPLSNSPKHSRIDGNNLNKLSLDVLSAQQLCDTSKIVVTPSACHLVSDELANCPTE